MNVYLEFQKKKNLLILFIWSFKKKKKKVYTFAPPKSKSWLHPCYQTKL